MSGNVYEWCQDWYRKYSSDPQTDPQGPSSASNRVLRGGGWFFLERNCRVSFRYYSHPDGGINSYGLRLVL